jgi:membrane protease YdiL (CAAX protease family)
MDQPTLHGAVLRIGTYLFLLFVSVAVSVRLIRPLSNDTVAGILSIFFGALAANLITLKIYERGRLPDLGLAWNRNSIRNLLIGLTGGLGAALLVLVGPLAVGAAELQPDPVHPGYWPSFVFLTVLLWLGALGEELLFRGYLFQILVERIGTWATLIPMAVLFGLAHSLNQGANVFSVINTILWGCLLGYAFLRSGDLWLPLGVHFGWNWMLPLFGVNLSGYTMGVTGYVMHWKVSGVWSGEGYGPEAGVLTLFVLPLLAWYLHRAPVHRQPAMLVPSLLED